MFFVMNPLKGVVIGSQAISIPASRRTGPKF